MRAEEVLFETPSSDPAAISLTGMPEVLVLTMQVGLRTSSMRVIKSTLIFRFSTMASMTQSASAITPKSSSRLPSVTSVFKSGDHQIGGFGFQTAIPAFS